VRLRHPDDVRTALTQIEEQVERRSLLGAELPARLELLDLVVSPRPDPSDLRAFDAERGIVLQPPDVDGVPDQDPELLERVQRGARAVGEGCRMPVMMRSRERPTTVRCPWSVRSASSRLL
jgi:hypothetical protein